MTDTENGTERDRQNYALSIAAPLSETIFDDVLGPFAIWLDTEETLPMSAKMALRLILEELLANTVMHGNAAANSEIALNLAVTGDGVKIGFRDHGVAFNPATDLPHDSREDTLENRPVGRLGWPLILHYCSLDKYERANGQNRLELTFKPGA
ncbi:MAG: ATP-binding protein [Alphaproteobacteria bacterium]